jgi:hypothetical protein
MVVTGGGNHGRQVKDADTVQRAGHGRLDPVVLFGPQITGIVMVIRPRRETRL